MKCRACAVQKFFVRTNPKGRCFDYTVGIHRKVEEFDTVDAGTLGVIDTDRGNGIVPSSLSSSSCRADSSHHNNDKNNPLEKLETRMTGKRKAMTERDAMQLLLDRNKYTMLDDASSNGALRSTYRNVRNEKRRRLRNAQDVGLGNGIELHDDVGTLEISPEDSLAFFRGEDDGKDDRSRQRETEKFASIRTASIFSDRGRRRRKGLGSKKNRVQSTKSNCRTEGDDLFTSVHSDCGDNACYKDYRTARERNEVVRTLKLDANIMKTDGRTAALTKGDTASESNDAQVSSLLILGEYDSDSH